MKTLTFRRKRGLVKARRTLRIKHYWALTPANENKTQKSNMTEHGRIYMVARQSVRLDIQ